MHKIGGIMMLFITFGLTSNVIAANLNSSAMKAGSNAEISMQKFMLTQNNFVPSNFNTEKWKSYYKKAKKVAKELQDVLAAKLLNTMYEGIKTDHLFGGGDAEKTFRSMLNDERAKIIDLGLVDGITKQIMKGKKELGDENDK